MKKYMLIYFLISASSLYCQWEFVGLDSMNVRQVYVFGDTIWAGTAVYNYLPKISGLYRSINSGKDWVQIDTALGEGAIGSLNFHPHNHNIIYLIKALNSPYGAHGTLYKSIDGGKTWEKINITIYPIKWFNISPFNDKKFYAVDGINNEVFKSIDGGDNWKLIGEFPVSSHGNFVAFNFSRARDSLLFALVDVQFYQAFYKSTDDGYSWQYLGTPPAVAQEILTDNEMECRIYLQSYFITNDCGLNWAKTDSIDFSRKSYYLSLFIDTASSKLYIMKTTGVYASDKRTINWELFSGSENLPLEDGYHTQDVEALENIFLLGKTMFVGTPSGLYKKDDITAVEDNQPIDYKNYLLSQNYPNPFNPTTKIKYTIPQFSFVTVKIYDLLGREITTLVNEEQSAGTYEIEFSANGGSGSKLSSGIYIYTIRAGDYAASKKMALIK